MAGQPGENEIADFADAGDLVGLWNALTERIAGIPEYVEMFIQSFDDISQSSDIQFSHVANAIAAFESIAWRADDSPFDQFLRGDKGALSAAQRKGMKLFYGKAQCVSCHSGKFQTDHDFHAVAIPQIGPGKGDGPEGRADFGRMRVTQQEADLLKFRTPSLRNVVLTGPWGHNGAFNSLMDVIEHHLDPESSLRNYSLEMAQLPFRYDLDQIDSSFMSNPENMHALLVRSELPRIELTEQEKSQLKSFLEALTDPSNLDMRALVPPSVPSGLPIYE